MGPTKTLVKGNAIYDAKTGKSIRDGFPSRAALEEYAAHHYLALPQVDNEGRPWELEGQPVYCLHGVQYETLDDRQVHLARCTECGGMGIRTEEVSIERDCIHCTKCGQELDARLEMMES